MNFNLKNNGVYKCEKTGVVVNNFEKKDNLTLKTFLINKPGIDELYIPVYFNIYEKDKQKFKLECSDLIEATIRSVCRQLLNTRKELVKRTKNNKIMICFGFVRDDFDLKSIEEAQFIIERELKSLGYEEIGFTKSLEIQEYEESEKSKIHDLQRDDCISWDEYFMAVAKLTALRSKDPSTQVGACIVNEDNIILATGYNGAPSNWDDDIFPWGRDGGYHDNKYPLVVHAEANAIMHCVGQGQSLKNSRIYVALFPCNQCAQLIVQSGIKEVIYLSDKYKDTDGVIASKRIFDKSGIKYRQYIPKNEEIVLRLRP